MLKNIIKKIIPLYIRKQIKNCIILSKEYGQYESIKRNSSIDKNGKEIPWYTYSAIEYLNHLDFSDKVVFEWGSGSSSIYWANRAKEVISIEADEKWFNKVSSRKKNNQEIKLLKNKDEYVDIISRLDKKFDIIVIDDRYRDDCLVKAPYFLKENGLIILDNSDRFSDDVLIKMRSEGFIQVDFHGFGPINGYTWTTSLFFCKNFNFDYKQNLKSIASIESN